MPRRGTRALPRNDVLSSVVGCASIAMECVPRRFADTSLRGAKRRGNPLSLSGERDRAHFSLPLWGRCPRRGRMRSPHISLCASIAGKARVIATRTSSASQTALKRLLGTFPKGEGCGAPADSASHRPPFPPIPTPMSQGVVFLSRNSRKGRLVLGGAQGL